MKLTRLIFGAALAAATAFSAQAQTIDSVRVTTGLTRPVYLTSAPGDDDRLFIIEKRGLIRIYSLADGALRSGSFLNIDSIVGGGTSTSSEQGLLCMAFHPEYADNGRFFVSYTNNSGSLVIARYSVSADPEVANPTGSILMTISQPYSNHNGCQLMFGPDGYLWISTGDGGAGNDPFGYGQNRNSLLGKMLRIDVE